MSEYTFQRGKSFAETERDMRSSNTDSTTRGLLHAAEPHPALDADDVEAEDLGGKSTQAQPVESGESQELIDAALFNDALAKTGIDLGNASPVFLPQLVRNWLKMWPEAEARALVGDAGYEALVAASTDEAEGRALADYKAEPIPLSTDDASLLEYLRAHESDLNDEQRTTLAELERREVRKAEESPAQ